MWYIYIIQAADLESYFIRERRYTGKRIWVHWGGGYTGYRFQSPQIVQEEEKEGKNITMYQRQSADCNTHTHSLSLSFSSLGV